MREVAPRRASKRASFDGVVFSASSVRGNECERATCPRRTETQRSPRSAPRSQRRQGVWQHRTGRSRFSTQGFRCSADRVDARWRHTHRRRFQPQDVPQGVSQKTSQKTFPTSSWPRPLRTSSTRARSTSWVTVTYSWRFWKDVSSSPMRRCGAAVATLHVPARASRLAASPRPLPPVSGRCRMNRATPSSARGHRIMATACLGLVYASSGRCGTPSKSRSPRKSSTTQLGRVCWCACCGGRAVESLECRSGMCRVQLDWSGSPRKPESGVDRPLRFVVPDLYSSG